MKLEQTNYYTSKECKGICVQLFDMGSVEQGIVHMVGPETGLTQPGKQSFVVIHIHAWGLWQSHLV